MNENIKDELLSKITGGTNTDQIVNIVNKILAEYDIKIERELIIEMIGKGGLTLRHYVESILPKEARGLASLIPGFDE